MKIKFAGGGKFTEAERQALQWLGERGKWLDVRVERRSAKEFDLGIDLNRKRRGYPKVSPSSFSAWLPLVALREFWSFGLLAPAYGDWSFTRDMSTPQIWAEFHRVVDLARSKPVFSPELLSAVWSTWQDLQDSDMPTKNSEAIELVLDADRLSTFGHEHADAEVSWLDQRFGIERVMNELCRQVKLV